jgi:hypothetical protein
MLVLACFVLGAFGVVAAQGDSQRELERARARWNELTPQRRAELTERFERWQSLSEEERTRLRERFDKFEPMRRSAHEHLSDKARSDFARLRPEQQAEVRAGVTSQQIQERGRELLERLPSHWRERLESAEPAERARLVEEFRARVHAKALERVSRLEAEGALTAEAAANLRKVTPEELARALVDFEVRRFRERVEREGLPAFMNANEWEQWKSLPQSELWERFHRARHQHEHHGRDKKDEGARDGREPSRREGERKGLGDAERRVLSALRPEPEWFVELVNAEMGTRMEIIGSRLRARVLGVLEAEPSLVARERVAELRALDGREFFEALSAALPQLELPKLRRAPGGRLPFERDGERPRSPGFR